MVDGKLAETSPGFPGRRDETFFNIRSIVCGPLSSLMKRCAEFLFGQVAEHLCTLLWYWLRHFFDQPRFETVAALAKL